MTIKIKDVIKNFKHIKNILNDMEITELEIEILETIIIMLRTGYDTKEKMITVLTEFEKSTEYKDVIKIILHLLKEKE